MDGDRVSAPGEGGFHEPRLIATRMSVAILRATPHMPFARSAEAALDRARRALSAERQRAMQRLQRRILIGAPASDRVRTTLGAVDDALLSVFEQCFTGARQMSFDYVDGSGAPTSRRIECVALMLHAPAWYVVAWDLDKDAPRVFRMDRMAAAAIGGPLDDRHPVALVIAQACPDAESAYADWIGSPIG